MNHPTWVGHWLACSSLVQVPTLRAPVEAGVAGAERSLIWVSEKDLWTHHETPIIRITNIATSQYLNISIVMTPWLNHHEESHFHWCSIQTWPFCEWTMAMLWVSWYPPFERRDARCGAWACWRSVPVCRWSGWAEFLDFSWGFKHQNMWDFTWF